MMTEMIHCFQCRDFFYILYISHIILCVHLNVLMIILTFCHLDIMICCGKYGGEEEMSLICSRICLLNGEVACSCGYLFSKLKLMDDELI